MDVAIESVFRPQEADRLGDHLHGVIGIPDDSGAEKKTFDIVAPEKCHRQLRDFPRGKRCAGDVGSTPVGTVCAVEHTGV